MHIPEKLIIHIRMNSNLTRKYSHIENKQKMIVIASIVNRINYQQVLFKGDKIAIKPTKT